MDFNITKIVATSIEELVDLLIGKEKGRGKSLSKLYLKNSLIINFGIIFGLGMLIQSSMSDVFGRILEDWVASPLAILSNIFWCYIMTVGPMGYLWGFNKKPIKVQETTAETTVEEDKTKK